MAEILTITIKGMSCDHCVQTLTKGLGEISGVEKVDVDLKKESAKLQVSTLTEVLKKKLAEKITDLGYEVAP